MSFHRAFAFLVVVCLFSCDPVQSNSPGAAIDAGVDSPEIPPKPCTEDVECDDSLNCNGVESCVDNVCAAGTALCAGIAESGCTVECDEASGACSKVPTDKDKDGHLPADYACSVATNLPKDDCDDSNNLRYPGNSEVCDGFDNDCNGKGDLAEGMPLAGEWTTILSQSAEETIGVEYRAAWSEELQAYGLVITTDKRLLLAMISAQGKLIGNIKALVDDNQNHTAGTVGVAWHGTTLGVVWATTIGNARTFYMGRFSVANQTATPQVLGTPIALENINGGTTLKVNNSGTWGLVAGSDLGTVLFRFTADGALISPRLNLGVGSYWSGLASLTDGFAVAWYTQGFDANAGAVDLKMATYTGVSLAETVGETVVIPGVPDEQLVSDGQLTMMSNGPNSVFLMAKPRSHQAVIAGFSGELQPNCAPRSLELGIGYGLVGQDGEPHATGVLGSAFYIGRTPEGPVHVVPLALDCTTDVDLGSTELFAQANCQGCTRLATGTGSHLAVIQAGADLQVRAFGHSFCNPGQ